MIRRLIVLFALCWPIHASAQATHILSSGTLPSVCRVGDIYQKTGTSAGFYYCSASNTWTAATSGGTVNVLPLATKTSAYSLTTSDLVILCDASSAALTLTLPTPSGHTGLYFVMKKIDSSANACTLAPNASETIDGASSLSTTVQYTSYSVITDGTNWFIF